MTRQTLYTDEKLFQTEQAALKGGLRYVCHESQVRQPGDWRTLDTPEGTWILMRGQDGQLRAFANSCRHVGMQLASGSGHCLEGQLVCPYHGWRYDTQGQLVEVPRQECFARVRKENMGLAQVPFQQAGPLIFLGSQDPALSELAADFAASHLEAMELRYEKTWDLAVNWKAVMEQGLESYHACTAHEATLSAHMDFEAITGEGRGDHHLACYPMKVPTAARLLGVLSGNHVVFHRATIFPFTQISAPIPGRHLTLLQVTPMAVDRTLVRFSFFWRGGFSPGRELALMSSLKILKEDLDLLPPRQMALQTPGPPLVGFGEMEKGARRFHDILDKKISKAQEPWSATPGHSVS